MIKSLKPNYESESGSKYFYNENGMFRFSNHWGRLANSKWRLISQEPETTSKFKLGFAKFEDFHKDNDLEQLYFLEFDVENQSINYNHKNNLKSNENPVLRTTFETRKKIKQARNILTLSRWAEYFESEIETLRFVIINELIYTNNSLETIKRNLK